MIALVATAALVPAGSTAAPANNEYGLDLPGGNGEGVDPAANASGNGEEAKQPAVAETSTAPAAPTETVAPATEEVVTQPTAGGRAGKAKAGDDRQEANLAAAKSKADKAGPAIDARRPADDGDGVPVFLIVIGALGLACVLAAAWRMRGSGVSGPAEATTRGA